MLVVTPEICSSFRERGFAVFPNVLNGLEVDRLRDAVTSIIAANSSEKAARRGRQWVPLLNSSDGPWTQLFFADDTIAAAQSLLQAPCAGVMVDANRLAVDSDLHRDADPPLKGLRFNIYLEPLAHGKGSLRLYSGSHRLEAGQRLPGGEPFVADVDAGDVLAMDLGVYHHAAETNSVRLFLSLFYYRRPSCGEERQAVRAAMLRNAAAPRHFLKFPDRAFPDAMETIRQHRPDWTASLGRVSLAEGRRTLGQ